MINQDRLERALRDIGVLTYQTGFSGCQCDCHEDCDFDAEVTVALTEPHALKLIDLAESLLDRGVHV